MDSLGPFITFRIACVSLLPAFFAALFWLNGYMHKVVLENKKFDAPSWVFEVFDVKKMRQGKIYDIYIGIGIAWLINFVWVMALLSEPGCGRWLNQTCPPIYGNIAFHNIAFLDIGGIIFELLVFFILISYYRFGLIRFKS